MSTPNDGGPAFPIADPFAVKCPETEAEALRLRNGISVRQYFAAKAMQGELAAMCATDEGPTGGLAMSVSDESLDRLAKHWFRIADAMIRAGGES